MERRLHHLALLLGLLASAAAYATEPVCDLSIIATQIALFCMPDMPTAPCCEPIIASVDLGGGIPCLCRVAAHPQLVLARLNATHLLSLFASCGGQHTGALTSPPPAKDVKFTTGEWGHERGHRCWKWWLHSRRFLGRKSLWCLLGEYLETQRSSMPQLPKQRKSSNGKQNTGSRRCAEICGIGQGRTHTAMLDHATTANESTIRL